MSKEYTYNNGILRVKSEMPIEAASYATIRREDTEKITTTTYRLGLRLRSKFSGGYFYAWYSATPQTVTVDNSPAINARLEAESTGLALAVAELAEVVEAAATEQQLAIAELAEALAAEGSV